jgi:iron complex transport system substrate-binding protein
MARGYGHARSPGLLAWLLCLGLLSGSLWAAPPAPQAERVAPPSPITLTDDLGHTVTLAAPARRIVTLLPSHTETVCALQACDRLVGTDRWSDWPAPVRALPKLGGLDDLDVEALVRLRPDVVIAARSHRALARLQALGVKVVALEPQTHADLRRSLDVVAALLGRPQAGAEAWAGIEATLQQAAARVPSGWRARAVYVEVGSEPYAAGPGSFVGQTLQALGLGNAIPAALGPFPKLNPEFVVRAQPALVLAQARAAAEMPRRPGWAALQALRTGAVCAFEPARWDLLVRPGPRLGEGAMAVADCLAGLPAAGR